MGKIDNIYDKINEKEGIMRSKKSIFNIIGAMGSYFATLVFNFITQACIVKFLGIEYSGVNRTVHQYYNYAIYS